MFTCVVSVLTSVFTVNVFIDVCGELTSVVSLMC